MIPPFSRTRSLQTRVTLLTLVIFVISIGLLAFYGSRILRTQIQELLLRQQASMANLAAADVNDALRDRIAALERLSKKITPALMLQPDTLQATLEDRTSDYALFNDGIAVASVDGTVIAEYPHMRGRLGANVSERDYFKGPLKEGVVTIGRPVMSKIKNAPAFVIGVPVRDPKGQVIGVLGGITDLSLPSFLDNITQTHYGNSGTVLVVSSRHRVIITASDKRRVMEQLPAIGVTRLVGAHVAGQGATEIMTDSRGEEVLNAARSVPVADWYVAVSLPTEEAFAPIREVQKQLLVATLFVTLLAGAMAWWMLARQLSPMLATARKLAQLSESGQTPLPLPITRADEVGELIGGFNRLLGTLAVREQKLKESEDRYRTLTDWTPQALAVHDGKKILYVNPAAIRMLGAKSASDLVGRAFLAAVPSEFREIVRASLRNNLEQGGPTALHEIKCRKVDGSTIAVEIEGAPIVFDGVPVRLIALRDLTQSKQDQAAFVQQARRSEALLKLPAAADGMNEKEFMQHGLSVAEQLTSSQIAFAHFVHDDEENIRLTTWSKTTLNGYCSASYDQHYPVSAAGIWADALRQRAPVLINDYASASGKRGLPEGHAHLDRLISVPVIEGGLVRMMVGVGNKLQPYTDLDVETTSLVAQALYRIVSKRRSDEAMHLSQASLKEAQHIAGIGSYALELSTGHWESSEELDRLFGITASYVRSVQSWEALVHPADRAMMSDYLMGQVVGQSQSFDKDYRIVRLNDQAERWVHGLGRLGFDAQGQLQKMSGTIQDITERKQSENQIQALAFFDPLTDLPNRRLLMDRLEQAMAAAARHGRQDALLFIDLDDFKTINDTLGHDKGDALLKQIAQRLSACVRERDTVARLGGDEFVVLLGDLSGTSSEAATQAQDVSAKILGTLGQWYEIEGHRHHSTASIGVTFFGGSQRERIEEPLTRAELAMYQAKTAGRNTLRFFEPEMRTAVTNRATLEAELRQAVVKGQFLLCYQPQWGERVALSGVEALVRWQHPQRGLVSPAEFIPVAEASGLILPLGRWVLEAACKQLAAWEARPEMSQLTIAVNVSARQFRQPNFVEEVTTLLQANGAKPERLKLELTESVLVENVEDIIIKMNALKARGVAFALDDFGTGYSSLSYLKRLPLDLLKIDKGFVRDILNNPNDAAIAKMVVVLADSLDLSVIAEGVETEAQRDFLASLGCHRYQGYLLSPPLPIQQFEAFVRQVAVLK